MEIARVIDIAPVVGYLVSENVAKRKGLFGGSLDERQGILIYQAYYILKRIYDEDSTYAGLQVVADYLLETFGRWTLAAEAIFDGGGGGQVAPPSGEDATCCDDIYPIYITAAYLDEDGNYDDENITGDNLIVFFNDNDEKFHVASADWFVYTPTGIRITAPYDETYTWRIEALGGGQRTATTPTIVNYNLTEDDTLIENIAGITEDGKVITVAVIPNGFTYTFDTMFVAGDQPALQTSTDVNTIQIFTFQYIAAANKLLLTGLSVNIPI